MRPAFSRHRTPTPISMLNVNAYEKSLPKEARRSTGAAYRIRTCDVLIRSQTLYPAEVTPQRKEYNHMMPALSQELFSLWPYFLQTPRSRPRTTRAAARRSQPKIAPSRSSSIEDARRVRTCPKRKKESHLRLSFNNQLVRRTGFEPVTF